MKGIQHIDSTMAAASSNHSPVAILHTTNRAIKYNLAAVVSELAHRHKAHRETGNMRDLGYRGGSRQMTNRGDGEWDTIGNADASGMCGRAAVNKQGCIRVM